MALKAKRFAEGYVSFYFNSTSQSWSALFTQMAPDAANQSRYYRIEIPVPEELLVQELPNQEEIKVSK